jgi:hypothetical protein
VNECKRKHVESDEDEAIEAIDVEFSHSEISSKSKQQFCLEKVMISDNGRREGGHMPATQFFTHHLIFYFVFFFIICIFVPNFYKGHA